MCAEKFPIITPPTHLIPSSYVAQPSKEVNLTEIITSMLIILRMSLTSSLEYILLSLLFFVSFLIDITFVSYLVQELNYLQFDFIQLF